MRKFLFIFAFFFVVLPIRATDLYIAQTATGGSTGADCGDALPYTFFNVSSNWPSPIGPGTTVHICGTITAPAGAGPFLTFQGSGTSGNPITLRFENGAALAAPYFSGNGAINTNGKNYITIDGNSLQGTIENTLSGTSGATCLGGPCAYQPDYSFGINCTSGSSNLTVQNLNIIDLYIHASLSDENGQMTAGINCTNGNTINISGNLIHDTKWAISAGVGSGTSSGINISGNTIYNVDHGIFYNVSAGTQTGPVNIFGNDVQTGTTWDDSANSNHHDFVHTSGTAGSLQGIVIYNNYLHGDPGTHGNAYFYTNTDIEGPIYFFNNVVVDTSSANFTAGGVMWCFQTVCHSYNNTFVAVANAHSAGGPNGAQMGGTGSTHENNIISGVAVGLSFLNEGNEVSDYNVFWQCCGASPALSSLGYNHGTYYQSLASWRSGTGYDLHSIGGNPDLNSGSVPPYQLSSGSAAIGVGTNLTSVCSGQPNPGLGALCSDRSGNPRPVTGAWDAGAYQSGGVIGNQPAAPTGLAATVQQ